MSGGCPSMERASRNAPCGGPWRASGVLVLCAALVGAASLCAGCALYFYGSPPPRHRADPARSAIGKALDYLEATQVGGPVRALVGGGDWPGDWPQYIWLPAFGVRVRDVSPFIPATIHASLGYVEEAARRGLAGLTADDAARVRAMRARAAAFIRRFEASVEGLPAGVMAYWPPMQEARAYQRTWLSILRGDWLLPVLMRVVLRGPAPSGAFGPLNIPQLPRAYGIHPDADTTSVIWACLLDEADSAGTPRPQPPLAVFAAWRDLGQVPLRYPTAWLERPSGLFLTWLGGPINDVDLVVNANVLYCLARYGALDLPGAAEATAALNRHVERFLRAHWADPTTPYYTCSLAPHCSVLRAFREGPVPGLRPAIERLARDIEERAQPLPDGTVCWDCGAPDLDTAAAVLALVACGRSLELARGGARYLVRTQDPTTGAWRECNLGGGSTESGLELMWRCRALTTATALFALVAARVEFGEGLPDDGPRSEGE